MPHLCHHKQRRTCIWTSRHTSPASNTLRGVLRLFGHFLLGTGIVFASGAEPVRTEMYPQQHDAVQGRPIDNQVFLTGKARARSGSTVIVSPSLKLRIQTWQVAVLCLSVS